MSYRGYYAEIPMSLNSQTVSALCQSMIRERCSATSLENEVIQFVVNQRRRMSQPFRAAVALLTWAFAIHCACRRFRSFHELNPAQQDRHIKAWRNSKIGPCREFVRLHESLAVFAWFSFQEERVTPARPHFNKASVDIQH